MSFEVEFKYRVSDREAFLAAVEKLGATKLDAIQQVDRYFNHPARDFGQTDEALRIRNTNGKHRITYKGPKVDAVSKTRREIELAFVETNDVESELADMLTILGFRETLAVPKTRQPWNLTWNNRAVEIVLDSIAGLGSFAEVETSATAADKDAAIDDLLTLANALSLHDSERRSYLEMLLEANQNAAD